MFSTATKFTLPELSYDYGELEPFINADLLKIHHSKHHQTYVNNLNVAYDKLLDAQSKNDLASVINLQQAVKFNGGGHLNHAMFWQNLSPAHKDGGHMPSGDLENMIKAQFGTLENLQSSLGAASVGVQGSGWGWLGFDKLNNRLAIATTGNQDLLQSTTGLVPLLAIDVWEHAYYLQYKNVRPDFVKNLWNVVNWKDVARRLAEAKL